MRKFLTKVLGDPNTKAVKALVPLVAEINELADEYARKTDEELHGVADELCGACPGPDRKSVV